MYNNHNESPRLSAFVEFTPKIDENGAYELINNQFDTTGAAIVFESSGDRDFQSSIMSNVQTLPNGNLLINGGRNSNFVEFDSLGNEVWRYRGPVSIFGPNEQGSNITGSTFRIEKFNVADPMFDTLDTSIKAEAIEINPTLTNCGLTSTTSPTKLDATIFPNPFDTQIVIETPELDKVDVELYNALGSVVLKEKLTSRGELDTRNLHPGVYFFKLKRDNAETTVKLIKLNR